MEQENLFLTENEIQVITEYSRRAEQRKELARLGIKFMVSRTGKPVVPRKAIDDILGINNKTKVEQEETIDLQALRETINGPQ
ncbi:MAG: DUF4224 domain-containing protein [Pseudomonadota bacterium]